MATKTLHEVRSLPGGWQVQPGDGCAGCSVGIMAHNEEANIGRTIHAVLHQHGPSVRIEEVIVVASGCTDRTVPLVAAIALQEPRVRLTSGTVRSVHPLATTITSSMRTDGPCW